MQKIQYNSSHLPIIIIKSLLPLLVKILKNFQLYMSDHSKCSLNCKFLACCHSFQWFRCDLLASAECCNVTGVMANLANATCPDVGQKHCSLHCCCFCQWQKLHPCNWPASTSTWPMSFHAVNGRNLFLEFSGPIHPPLPPQIHHHHCHHTYCHLQIVLMQTMQLHLLLNQRSWVLKITKSPKMIKLMGNMGSWLLQAAGCSIVDVSWEQSGR